MKMPWRLFYSFRSGPVFIAFALFLHSVLTIKSRADKTVLLFYQHLEHNSKIVDCVIMFADCRFRAD